MKLAADVWPSRSCGLTLIEVLIALAIVSLALTAVLKAASQSLRTTDYLQQKTTALWIAEEILNEASVGLLVWPTGTNTLSETKDQLGKVWRWQAVRQQTPNRHIDKIEVNVYPGQDGDELISPLSTLEGYVDHQT